MTAGESSADVTATEARDALEQADRARGATGPLARKAAGRHLLGEGLSMALFYVGFWSIVSFESPTWLVFAAFGVGVGLLSYLIDRVRSATSVQARPTGVVTAIAGGAGVGTGWLATIATLDHLPMYVTGVVAGVVVFAAYATVGWWVSR